MRRVAPVRGMSLVELLVAIAIIGAICAFLMPAVQSAREAARRAQCKNNLKQIALALQSYEGTCNVFPPSPLFWPTYLVETRDPGVIPARLAMHALILPGIDHAATFNAINFQVSEAANNLPSLANPGINATAARVVIATFLCPSDAASPHEPYGPTNYRANIGDCGVCGGHRGDFRNGAFNGRGTRPADFTDGLSMTIALSEKPVGGAPVGLYAPMRDWIFRIPPGNSSVMSADAWRQYCAGLSYSDSLPYVRYDGGRTWMMCTPHIPGSPRPSRRTRRSPIAPMRWMGEQVCSPPGATTPARCWWRWPTARCGRSRTGSPFRCGGRSGHGRRASWSRPARIEVLPAEAEWPGVQASREFGGRWQPKGGTGNGTEKASRVRAMVPAPERRGAVVRGRGGQRHRSGSFAVQCRLRRPYKGKYCASGTPSCSSCPKTAATNSTACSPYLNGWMWGICDSIPFTISCSQSDNSCYVKLDCFNNTAIGPCNPGGFFGVCKSF